MKDNTSQILFSHEELLQLVSLVQSSVSLAKTEKNAFLWEEFKLSQLPQLLTANKFQIFVVGSRHLECATVKRKHGKEKLTSHEVYPLVEQTSGEELFSSLAQKILPTTTEVVVSFAYPLKRVERDGYIDGILLSSTKEQHFQDLEGKTIGEAFENYLQKTLHRKIKVVAVINDTTTLALSGTQYAKKHNKITLAGIVASGLNIGFFEDNDRFINIESGNAPLIFESLGRSLLDKTTRNQGTYLFEKEVGEIYLWQRFNIEASLRGFEKRIHSPNELYDLVENGDGEEGNLARNLLQRAASLVAVQLFALYRFSTREHETAPSCDVIMKGDLFWKAPHFQEWVVHYLEILGLPQGIITFIRRERGCLFGLLYLVHSTSSPKLSLLPYKKPSLTPFCPLKDLLDCLLLTPNSPPQSVAT